MSNKVLKAYKISFETKLNPIPSQHSYVKKPVDHLEIVIYAEDVTDAINKAWQSITLTPNDYEIYSVLHNNHHYRWRFDENEEDE